jgi:hypothetical protein
LYLSAPNLSRKTMNLHFSRIIRLSSLLGFIR